MHKLHLFYFNFMQPFHLKQLKKVAFECKKVAVESYFFLIYYGMYGFLGLKKRYINCIFFNATFLYIY